MLTLQQIRAARALLGWSQQHLADAVGISITALNQIERGHANPRHQTAEQIENVFEAAGIEFLPQSGLRLRDNKLLTIEGENCLSFLQNDVYETLAPVQGELCVMGVTDRYYQKTDEKAMQDFLDRARKSGITERVIVEEGDDFFLFPADFTTYRWLEKRFFKSMPFYAYHNKIAFLIWGNPLRLIIIHDENLFEAFMGIFELMWETTLRPTRIKSHFK